MRKILYLLGTLFFFFFNLINIKASAYIDPVDFEIEDEFYLKVQKQIQNRTTYFTVENSLGAMELTEEQLRTILSRMTLENQSYLTIYSSLNIKVTPLEDTVFESLLNTLSPTTRLCVARALTTADEWVRTHTVSQWRNQPRPELNKYPSLFLFQANA